MRKGGRRKFRAPLSDESSGDPQNEQKLTPLSCPGITGRHAGKKVREYGSRCRISSIPGFVLLFFCEKDTAGERQSAYSVIRNGIAFRLCLLLLCYF